MLDHIPIDTRHVISVFGITEWTISVVFSTASTLTSNLRYPTLRCWKSVVSRVKAAAAARVVSVHHDNGVICIAPEDSK